MAPVHLLTIPSLVVCIICACLQLGVSHVDIPWPGWCRPAVRCYLPSLLKNEGLSNTSAFRTNSFVGRINLHSLRHDPPIHRAARTKRMAFPVSNGPIREYSSIWIHGPVYAVCLLAGDICALVPTDGVYPQICPVDDLGHADCANECRCWH